MNVRMVECPKCRLNFDANRIKHVCVKEYLGDGAYVDFDGYAIVLTAENGIEATDRIVLEPEVYAALVAYVERLRAAQKETT